MARPSASAEKAKTRLSLNPGVDDINQTWEFTYETFKEKFEENPRKLFENIDRDLARLQNSLTDVERQLLRKEEDIEAAKHQLAEKEVQIDLLINERDEFQHAVARMAVRQLDDTPASPTGGTQRSVKLPDPPILTDGKEPKFEDWLSKIKGKLRANEDHYTTEALRIAYIENRTGGDAAKHLAPRLREDSLNYFQNADEMLKYLEAIYLDPNRL